MGNLHALIDVIKDMSVSVGNVTPTVYDVDQARGYSQRSALPLRYITPFSESPMVGAVAEFGIGNTSEITWTITDRLLWRLLSGGIGVDDVSDDLVIYLDNYIDAARALQDWSTVNTSNDIQVQGIVVTIREAINFPAGSESWYVGADAIWTITEVDP